MRIFCELRRIFSSPAGARKNRSNEQNAHAYYILNLTVTKRKRKTHQEKPPSTQAKVNAHLFSKRIEHVGFSKLSQANLTETEVERFMNLNLSSFSSSHKNREGNWGELAFAEALGSVTKDTPVSLLLIGRLKGTSTLTTE